MGFRFAAIIPVVLAFEVELADGTRYLDREATVSRASFQQQHLTGWVFGQPAG
jgi:hypothetical protein